MTAITIDTENQARQAQTLLTNLTTTTDKETITDDEIASNRDELLKDYNRLRDCRDNIATANEQIALLEKALIGWRNFRDHQSRRVPGLERRYELKRDWIRAAEDEQTGE